MYTYWRLGISSEPFVRSAPYQSDTISSRLVYIQVGRFEKLGKGVQSLPLSDLESCPEAEEGIYYRSKLTCGLMISPDTCFVHASVKEWMRDNSLESLTARFHDLGIYEHADLVNVACCLRSSGQFTIELQRALDLTPQSWVSLKSALLRYARPVEYAYVKASKTAVNPESKHEYLFDEAEWRSQERVLEDEARKETERREAWINARMRPE